MVKVEKMYRFQNPQGKTMAMCDVCIDGIHIKGFKVIQGSDALFMAVPSEKSKKSDKWYELVRFDSDELRSEVSRAVLSAYHKSQEL